MTDERLIYGLTEQEVAALSHNDDSVHYRSMTHDINELHIASGWTIPRHLLLGWLNWAFALGRVQGRKDEREAVTFVVVDEPEPNVRGPIIREVKGEENDR